MLASTLRKILYLVVTTYPPPSPRPQSSTSTTPTPFPAWFWHTLVNTDKHREAGANRKVAITWLFRRLCGSRFWTLHLEGRYLPPSQTSDLGTYPPSRETRAGDLSTLPRHQTWGPTHPPKTSDLGTYPPSPDIRPGDLCTLPRYQTWVPNPPPPDIRPGYLPTLPRHQT